MRTHYDVLNLEKNCSAKEIKDSFLNLSKKYHPDKNKSSEAHKKFVEVNEAYSVLGKSGSRLRYDETLLHQKPRTVHTNNMYERHTTTKTPYEYYSEMYANNLRRNQTSNQGYFTRSKLNAVGFCLLLMAIGSGLQLMAETKRRRVHSHHIAVMVREQRLRKEKRRKENQQAALHCEPDTLNPRED